MDELIRMKKEKSQGEIAQDKKTPISMEKMGKKAQKNDNKKKKKSTNIDEEVKGLPHKQVPQPSDFSAEALEKL